MVIEALAFVIFNILQGLIEAVLPASSGLPFTIPTGLLTGYAWLDGMAPLHEMVQVAGYLVATQGLILFFGLMSKVWQMIRG
jgi:hypothetical protein